MSKQIMEWKPASKKKKTTEQYLKEINKDPGKYGTTRTHVDRVDKIIKAADKTIDGYNAPPLERPEMTIGIYARAKARLCKVKEINNELITVEFPNNKTKEYHVNDIKVALDQKKADKRYKEGQKPKGNDENLCIRCKEKLKDCACDDEQSGELEKAKDENDAWKDFD